jgi:hypothetical protein
MSFCGRRFMSAKEVAIRKRAQIDKATQIMLLAVGAASVVLGCSAVLSVYFVRYMNFNAGVIGEQDQIIEDFKEAQNNVTQLTQNIGALAEDENLEVVARARESRCMGLGDRPADMTSSIGLARICSALRVIPDALPSVSNPEAVFASLNKLFLETRNEAGEPVEPDVIAPGGNSGNHGITLEPGLRMVPVTLMIENTTATARAVLDTIERSIRNYDIMTVIIGWRGGGSGSSADAEIIEMRGEAVAYHADMIEVVLQERVIYADPNKTTGGVRR